MNLLEILAKNDALVSEMAQGLGIGSQQARSGIEALLPALARGMRNNARSGDGLGTLARALESGRHSQYYERPERLGHAASLEDGNNILGHILGSKDVSRNVAARASQQTGLESSLLKKMLPMLAAAAMGAMSQQRQGGGLLEQVLGSAISGGLGRGTAPANPSSPGLEMLETFLDSDRDGSVLDDVLSMAQKFL